MTAMDVNQTVGELVTEKPARSRVFESLGIDYCCGGKTPLREACAAKGLDADTVLTMLLASENSGSGGAADRSNAMSLTELADHIEQTHHVYLKRELPRLGAMVRKVAAVHGDRHPWLLELDGVYAGFAAEMDSHLMKEEQILFPLIRDLEAGRCDGTSPCGHGISNPVRAMEHEHDDAGAALARMRGLSSDYQAPDGACNTFRAMLDGLREIEADTHEHVHKENNILFPRAMELE